MLKSSDLSVKNQTSRNALFQLVSGDFFKIQVHLSVKRLEINTQMRTERKRKVAKLPIFPVFPPSILSPTDYEG